MKLSNYITAGCLAWATSSVAHSQIVFDPAVLSAVLESKEKAAADAALSYTVQALTLENFIWQMTQRGSPTSADVINSINSASAALTTSINQGQSVATTNTLNVYLGNVSGSEQLTGDYLAAKLVGNIGSSMKFADGSTTARNAELYRPEAATQAQVTQYQITKDTINQRRDFLRKSLASTMARVHAAKTDSEVEKLTTLIHVLEGELASVQSEVDQASADMTALQNALTAQQTAKVKAESEKNKTDLSRALQAEMNAYTVDNSNKTEWEASE